MKCPLCQAESPKLFCERSTGESYFLCVVCGLAHLGAEFRLKAEEEKGRYLLHKNDPEDLGYIGFLRRLADPLVEKLSPQSQGLDYGAGPGPALARHLTSLGYQTEVYDPFFHPQAQVLERTYHFVTCTEAAEHFYEPLKEFERMFSILKPFGHLGVMTEFLHSPPNVDEFLSWYYARDPSHVCFYQARTMEWLAERFKAKLVIPRKNVALFELQK